MASRLRLRDFIMKRKSFLSWLILLEITTKGVLAYFLKVLTQGQMHVVDSGESLTLVCSFNADDYNLFDYPVLWRKVQKDEATQVNIMGNINEPFVSTNRFEVAYNSSPPLRRLELSILDVSQEDSGNYTCEIRGPQSVVLGHVTHYLFVRAPVERIFITSDLNIASSSSSSLSSQRVLEFTEATPSALRCVAVGGYPPPSLSLILGTRDVTSAFRFVHSAVMSGRRGLRTITYQTERFSEIFVAQDSDDDAVLKCISVVPGLRPFTEYARLSVDYSPKVTCLPAEAFLGEKNVYIRCEIRSKPKLTAMFWLIDPNGTALAEGDVIDGLWTIVVDRVDGFVEVQLFMRQARPEFFRKYTIVAENTVAVESVNVILTQKFRPTVSNGAAAAAGHVFKMAPSHDARRKNSVNVPNDASSNSPTSALGQPAPNSHKVSALTVTVLLYTPLLTAF